MSNLGYTFATAAGTYGSLLGLLQDEIRDTSVTCPNGTALIDCISVNPLNSTTQVFTCLLDLDNQTTCVIVIIGGRE